jgi:hypothetical protein
MTKENYVFILVLSVLFGFGGYLIGKTSQKPDRTAEIELNELKHELLKQQYNAQLKEIRFEMLRNSTFIDDANPVQIDSLWSNYGFD